jgi:hypothetical protein
VSDLVREKRGVLLAAMEQVETREKVQY